MITLDDIGRHLPAHATIVHAERSAEPAVIYGDGEAQHTERLVITIEWLGVKRALLPDPVIAYTMFEGWQTPQR